MATLLKQSPLQHHPSLKSSIQRLNLLHTRSLTIRCNNTPSHKTDSNPSSIYSSISTFAPATIANLGPGFDFLGCAVDGIGDEVTLRIDPTVHPGSISISSISGDDSKKLSLNPEFNCAGRAAIEVTHMLGIRSVGLSMSLEKGVPLEIGLGSSAASAAAAAVAVNELFGSQLLEKDLVVAVHKSELKENCSTLDHIAPAIVGGFVLINSYDPVNILKLPFPTDAELFFVLTTPKLEGSTKKMWATLPNELELDTAHYRQTANLTVDVLQGNVQQLGYSLSSKQVVESSLISGIAGVQRAALDTGAFGFTISGKGPTVIAVTDNEDKGKEIGARMVEAFEKEVKLKASTTVKKLDPIGARVISRND